MVCGRLSSCGWSACSPPAVPALAAACLAAALKGDLTPNALDPKRAVCRFARLSRIQEEKKVPIFLGAEMGARRAPPRRGRGALSLSFNRRILNMSVGLSWAAGASAREGGGAPPRTPPRHVGATSWLLTPPCPLGWGAPSTRCSGSRSLLLRCPALMLSLWLRACPRSCH